MKGSSKDSHLRPIVKGEAPPEKLWGFVDVDPFLMKPNFQRWALNIVMAVLLTAIFTYPWYEVKLEGQFKVGDIAEEDIFAPDDMSIPDNELTQVMRDRARDNALSVFDFDPRLTETMDKRLRENFKEFRALYQPEWDWNDAEKNRMEILRKEFGNRRAKPVTYVPEDDFAEREQKARAAFLAMLDGIGSGKIDLSDKQFAILKSERFSVETENKILTLVIQVMNEGVVFNKDQLPTEPGKGITVRTMPFREPAKDEVDRRKISGLHNVEEARQLIDDRAYDMWGKDIPRNLRLLIVSLSKQLVVPNYTFNKGQTEAKIVAAVEGVKVRDIPVKKGEKIVGRGEEITDDMMVKLNFMQKAPDVIPIVMKLLGHFFWIAAFLAILFAFPVRTIKKFTPNFKDLLHLAGLLLILLLGLKALETAMANIEMNENIEMAYIVPVVAGAMMIRLVLNSEVTIIFSVVISVLAGMMVGSPSYGMFVLLGSLVGAGEVGYARTRGVLMKAGLVTGMANVFLVLTIALANGNFLEPASWIYNVLMAFSAGILASSMVLGLMPVVESLFGYATDIRLLELANQEHPLLKLLITNAPGTYQHSIMVGTLAEAAAEAIHVNPLLAKVSALYHDVGKMEKSMYYVENQRDGRNPHDKLAPSMSGLVISSHVKYGMELGRIHGLPQVIIDAIPQHHGTSLIKYFYARAKEKEDPGIEHIEEKDYRYEGPKPQTRETGILMLADKVEATARSMNDPTAPQLKGMVRRSINDVFNDGQLDECDLTLKDLTAIADAFTKVLTSIYHTRPEYPAIPGSGSHGSGGHHGGKKNGSVHKDGQNGKSGSKPEEDNIKKIGENNSRTPL